MYLIDTNIASELKKGENMHPGVHRFLARAADARETLVLSVITVGELRYGIDRIRRRGDAPQADKLESWFGELVTAFENRILPVDADVAQLWGQLLASNPHNKIDKLIAATALLYDLTVVTRNERDFVDTGVRVFNPYTD